MNAGGNILVLMSGKFWESSVDRGMNVFENIGSMPPALLINYGALYDKHSAAIQGTKNVGKK